MKIPIILITLFSLAIIGVLIYTLSSSNVQAQTSSCTWGWSNSNVGITYKGFTVYVIEGSAGNWAKIQIKDEKGFTKATTIINVNVTHSYLYDGLLFKVKLLKVTVVNNNANAAISVGEDAEPCFYQFLGISQPAETTDSSASEPVSNIPSGATTSQNPLVLNNYKIYVIQSSSIGSWTKIQIKDFAGKILITDIITLGKNKTYTDFGFDIKLTDAGFDKTKNMPWAKFSTFKIDTKSSTQPTETASCQNYCGKENTVAGCWCDELSITKYNDACSDIQTACPEIYSKAIGSQETTTGPTDITKEASCSGYCGAKAPSGCWCDIKSITTYNDACSDIQTACPAIYEEATGIQNTTSKPPTETGSSTTGSITSIATATITTKPLKFDSYFIDITDSHLDKVTNTGWVMINIKYLCCSPMATDIIGLGESKTYSNLGFTIKVLEIGIGEITNVDTYSYWAKLMVSKI